MRISTSARFRPAQFAGPYEKGMKAAAFVRTSSGCRASEEMADSNSNSDSDSDGPEAARGVEAADCFGVRLAELECSQRSGQNVSGLGEK